MVAFNLPSHHPKNPHQQTPTFYADEMDIAQISDEAIAAEGRHTQQLLINTEIQKSDAQLQAAFAHHHRVKNLVRLIDDYLPVFARIMLIIIVLASFYMYYQVFTN
ncbi:MAG: hypothetical protein JKX85_10685 [Phycisphaeraceae bacterium]|nr:hypothetical protein [Phycisphaeraceae bacterium]